MKSEQLKPVWLNMGDSYAMSSMCGGTKDFKWEPKAGHKGIRAPRAWEASGRDSTLIELNPEYIEIAQKLIKRDMFSEVEIK
jgi:hypothetical protein